MCFLQSATHVFVVCLALSDLALCLFSLPVQLHYQLTDNWYLGSALCRIIFAAFAVPMYLSTITIMLIAVDRCDTTITCINHRSSVWRRGVVVNALVVINEVTLRRARLVLGWVIVCGRVNHLGM